jgi:Holliday junction DNA helicase RuvA
MIYSLKGKVEMIDSNTIVVDTGNMAFEVICSSYAAFDLSNKTEEQTVLTYLQVREDAMVLFGFKDKKEKTLFNQLITVSGVGPKMAITILSGLPINDIIGAILSSDIKLLSSIKGLGKKTAERVILELSSKLGVDGALENLVSTDISVGLAKEPIKKEIEEASEVLISTGVQKIVAVDLAKSLYRDGMSSEQLVLECFKNMKK